MSEETKEERARRRAQLIVRVQSGLMTATDAARELGVSRKTYYEWEQRALAAMAQALEDRPGGRPAKTVDPEKEQLSQQNRQLQEELKVSEATLAIREALAKLETENGKKNPDSRGKRDQRAAMILEQIRALKAEVDRPYRPLCEAVEVGYASFMRWKTRQDRGAILVQRPGPKTAGSLDLVLLEGEVRRLDHGRWRSGGAGELFEQVRQGISRRDFGELVVTVRRQLWRERDANLQRVQWLVPGVVWSVDPTELVIPGPAGRHRLRLLPVLDLASRYKFAPWVGESLTGLQVADHLEELFRRYGAPLVLKRDNGSNLNDEAVNKLLARWLVIPLNSPPHYPRYNGAIERAQRELKAAFLARWLEIDPRTGPASAVAAWTVYDLNRQPRRCLRRQSAAAIFCGAKNNLGAYTERRRKEAFDTINGLIMNAVAQREVYSQPQLDAAQRRAVETWLQREGIITLTKPQCVTQFQ